MLNFSNLRAREHDAVFTFSGGMKQRVSLACALVHRPRVLMLDEPTAGVDPRLRAEFWKHFRELARGGATLLISTHQMDEALVCDRLAMLSDGEMVACDTPKNLARSRPHPHSHLARRGDRHRIRRELLRISSAAPAPLWTGPRHHADRNRARHAGANRFELDQTMNRTLAVAERVLHQLARDRRFLGLSIVAPLLVIYISKAALDSFNVPFVNVSQFVVPIGAFIVHFATYILCAIVLVRERTAETLARMFVNGYGRTQIIGGYVFAYTCVATVQSLLVLAELSLLYRLRYSVAVLLSIYLVIWLLAIISICLGIFVSNFARNEGQVLPFIPLVTVPGVFLSDVIFSVDRLPQWAQWLSHATPLFYANQILQRLIKNGTLAENWTRVAFLVLYGAVVLFLATRTLRESD